MVRSRRRRSSSSFTSGENSVVKPRYPGATLRSRRASACSSLVFGCRKTGKSRPTGMKPARSSSAGVAPTTTQSRSDTSRPSSRSRTAPPTKYTCMARMLTIRTALVLTACLALAGCGTTYVAQAAKGQLQILTARKPITKILADPAADARLKQRLEVVREARDFASRELGLPNNKSYTSYADLKRDFVVWSVVATPEFSVAPREWCFPIVGCVAYRGYFRKDSAEAFAETLRSEGLDTMVGGVPAYSTLGKFNDPILNTMMVYGDDELASIMFHELSHQLVYIQDDTSFNEAFAVAVEQEGLARWLRYRGREGDLVKYQKRRARQAEGVALVTQFRGELSSLYGMKLEPDVMRARKAQVFARLVTELRV